MSKKIIITIQDDISQEQALERVLLVVWEGRVSKNNTLYCYATLFEDGIMVKVNDYRKNDCFVVYKTATEGGEKCKR